jgi:hypothetical protein
MLSVLTNEIEFIFTACTAVENKTGLAGSQPQY